MLPFGMPGMLKFLFFSITNSRFGTDLVRVYGPMPGGGSAERFSNGVSPGTSPAKFIASTFRIVPSGPVSLIVTSPVSSLVSIPEMSPSGLPASMYSWAPSMIRKKPVAPDSRLSTRLIVCSKSEALSGVPSANFRPLRIVKVTVLPSSETSGIFSATPGISSVPSLPSARL